MLDRAYSTFEVKSIDAEQRVIEGWASTPDPDRGGDVMVPEGAQYSLPQPFLWFHDSQAPIGEVFFAEPSSKGIFIKARLAKVKSDGPVKSRVDEAWASLSSDPPLVRGLSIGWSPIEGEYERIPGTKLTRYRRWVWGETSAVTIPMNVGASIVAVKQFDQVASGHHSPGVSGTSTVVRGQKDAPPMTTAEQITSFENKRAANVAAMNALMTKAAGEGVTLDDTQREEYTTLEREVDAIDEHLPRLRKLEQMNVKNATAITTTTSQATASALRGGETTTVVQVKSMLPKGTAFVRYAMSLAAAKGDSYRAMSRAESYKDTPEVLKMVQASLDWSGKAAVAAGTTTDSTWAGPLVVAQPLVDEFIELLRPRTLIGRIPRLRQVPFNVSVPTQTAGGTYGWVGQGKAKAVTKNDFSTTTLTWAKAAGIIVLTEELVKVSSPSAEALVKEDMIAGIQKFLDEQLMDPSVTAVADTNPASITNGATSAAASGTTGAAARADIAAQIAAFAAAEIPLDGMVILMNESNAFALGLALNALGQPLFPGVSQSGGTLMGIPVIVSNSVGARIVFVHAPSILFADDGGVNIDTSREASIQMDSAPTEPTDASTVLVSLWQRNLVGLRAERFITWKRARTAAVRYISSAAYTGA